MKRSAITLALVLLAPMSALAWSGSPVLVDGVTSGPHSVAVAHGGDYGALVAWQSAGATGELRVTHLLPDGSADPAWPTGGMALAAGVATRTGLTAIGDESGGAYLHWQEGQSLYLTRVLASGAVAPGWTARGRLLGQLSTPSHRPWTELDAAGGIYVGWFQGIHNLVVPPTVRVIHLGPNGLGAGGWPTAARTLPLDDAYLERVSSASFAVAEDGGVWALVATGREGDGEDAGVVSPGEWRLGRFMANGTLDPSRPAKGTVLGAFEADQLASSIVPPRIGLGAVVADGAGGVLTAIATVEDRGDATWSATARLERRLADGSLHPAQGTPRVVGWWGEAACGYSGDCQGASISLRLLTEGPGGITLAAPESYVHGGNLLRLSSVDVFGAHVASLGQVGLTDASFRRALGGGYLFSSLIPSGPTSQYDPGPPRVGLSWSDDRESILEQAVSPYDPVYADLDAAALPDGGAIAVWSRILGTTGLYAQRVGANGSVLGVPAVGASARLRLQRAGRDLLATWPAGAPGTLRLLDLQGRELARHEVGESAGEATLLLSRPPAPGVLFGRLTRRDGTRADARVVVLR